MEVLAPRVVVERVHNQLASLETLWLVYDYLKGLKRIIEMNGLNTKLKFGGVQLEDRGAPSKPHPKIARVRRREDSGG